MTTLARDKLIDKAMKKTGKKKTEVIDAALKMYVSQLEVVDKMRKMRGKFDVRDFAKDCH